MVWLNIWKSHINDYWVASKKDSVPLPGFLAVPRKEEWSHESVWRMRPGRPGKSPVQSKKTVWLNMFTKPTQETPPHTHTTTVWKMWWSVWELETISQQQHLSAWGYFVTKQSKQHISHCKLVKFDKGFKTLDVLYYFLTKNLPVLVCLDTSSQTKHGNLNKCSPNGLSIMSRLENSNKRWDTNWDTFWKNMLKWRNTCSVSTKLATCPSSFVPRTLKRVPARSELRREKMQALACLCPAYMVRISTPPHISLSSQSSQFTP